MRFTDTHTQSHMHTLPTELSPFSIKLFIFYFAHRIDAAMHKIMVLGKAQKARVTRSNAANVMTNEQ